jgi:phosphoenolpyruvate phosphomutase
MTKRFMKKTVYVPLAADILNEGHLNILRIASNYGKVIVGLLTDAAIIQYKSLPFFDYDQRFKIVSNLKLVDQVVPQDSWNYSLILNSIKPDFFVHGDDWKTGVQVKIRLEVIKELKKWNGKLIEPKYFKNFSKITQKKKILNLGITPDQRKLQLKRLLKVKKIIRIMESHSALSSLIIENININRNGKVLQFDGIWSSSLTDSALKGKPDNQSVDYSQRLNSLNETIDTSLKPIIFDGDNGGRIEHLGYLVKNLEKIGVSALVLEDKKGLKINSLFKDQAKSFQESAEEFSKKIKIAINSRISKDFMIVARIESLILGKSLKDAINRAEKYSKAGADAILIHSNKNRPTEIFNFAKVFKRSKFFKPMIAIPSTYSKTYEKELINHGFKIVIYANHLLRASYKAMYETAEKILINQRAFESEKKITPINNIISLIKS